MKDDGKKGQGLRQTFLTQIRDSLEFRRVHNRKEWFRVKKAVKKEKKKKKRKKGREGRGREREREREKEGNEGERGVKNVQTKMQMRKGKIFVPFGRRSKQFPGRYVSHSEISGF